MAPKIKANISNLEDFLYEIGPVNTKEQVSYNKTLFEVYKSRGGLEIYVENPPGKKSELNKFRNGIVNEIKGKFTGINIFKNDGVPYVKVGSQTITFDIEEDVDIGGGGVIPTKIQEEGTTVVLNQVLHNNKKFDKKEDILDDSETAKELKKLFGKKYEGRLKEWTHSYFEQQKEFLKKFQSAKWDIFVYGKDDFVTFFSKQIKNVARSLDPIKPVGNYTTWNPSDIWAVYEGDKVKKEIEKNINPKTQNLVELNNLLINLFQEKKLVGLSLKKIASNKSAKLKFVNIDTSTMKIGEIETFDMKDISFDIDNIFIGDKVTTYVKLGRQGEYSINITRAGQNLSFNTAIKATPAAQGGQAPVKMIQDLLKKSGPTSFINDHNKYPQSIVEYQKEAKKYSDMYKFLGKYFKKSVPYSEFESNLYAVYSKDKRNAIVKLMTLNFFHDSLKNNSKNKEFWTDMLYLGMKVGKRFSPHAKIS